MLRKFVKKTDRIFRFKAKSNEFLHSPDFIHIQLSMVEADDAMCDQGRRRYPTRHIVTGSSSFEFNPCKRKRSIMQNVASLEDLCIDLIVESWESPYRLKILGENRRNFPLMLSNRLPFHLVSKLLTRLITGQKISSNSMCELLSISAETLDLTGCSVVKKSVLRSIGYICTNLTNLNLSKCSQVNNSVVRTVLQGCKSLRQLYLDECPLVTDNGFNLQQSPFQLLVGCVSLETLSVSDCPQISGQLVVYLHKLCHNLKELNLSKCKSVNDNSISDILLSGGTLETLNMSFLGNITNSAFDLLRFDGQKSIFHERLLHLNVSRCPENITSLGNLRVFHNLQSLHLHFCLGLLEIDFINITQECVSLRAIGLGNCGNIGDLSLQAIATNCKSIRWLDVSWCEVSDHGVSYLSNCLELKEIILVWCSITDDALQTFSHLVSYCSLKTIILDSCQDLSKSALESLSSTRTSEANLQYVHVSHDLLMENNIDSF